MFTKIGNGFMRSLFPALACLIVASCATVQRDEASIDTSALKENEGIAFFAVSTHLFRKGDGDLTDEGTKVIAYSMSYYDTSRFFGRTGSIEGDTKTPDFFVVRRLPAGEYSIHRMDASIGALSASVPTDIRFTVAPKAITYLGTLHLEFHENRSTPGQYRTALPMGLKVADDRDNATKFFSKRYPDFSYDILANLMQVNK